MKTIYKIHETESGNLVLRTESKIEAITKFNNLPKGYEISVCIELNGSSIGTTLVNFK